MRENQRTRRDANRESRFDFTMFLLGTPQATGVTFSSART